MNITTHRVTLDIHIENDRVTGVKFVDDKLILNMGGQEFLATLPGKPDADQINALKQSMTADDEIITNLMKENARLTEENIKLRKALEAIASARTGKGPGMSVQSRPLSKSDLQKLAIDALAALPPEMLKDKP